MDPEVVIKALLDHSPLDVAAVNDAAGYADHMTTDSWDVYYQRLFRDYLEEYLRGSGHPDHPDVIAAVGEEEFRARVGDPLLRARLFLHMMSGSDLVPVKPDWKLEVGLESWSFVIVLG